MPTFNNEDLIIGFILIGGMSLMYFLPAYMRRSAWWREDPPPVRPYGVRLLEPLELLQTMTTTRTSLFIPIAPTTRLNQIGDDFYSNIRALRQANEPFRRRATQDQPGRVQNHLSSSSTWRLNVETVVDEFAEEQYDRVPLFRQQPQVRVTVRCERVPVCAYPEGYDPAVSGGHSDEGGVPRGGVIPGGIMYVDPTRRLHGAGIVQYPDRIPFPSRMCENGAVYHQYDYIEEARVGKRGESTEVHYDGDSQSSHEPEAPFEPDNEPMQQTLRPLSDRLDDAIRYLRDRDFSSDNPEYLWYLSNYSRLNYENGDAALDEKDAEEVERGEASTHGLRKHRESKEDRDDVKTDAKDEDRGHRRNDYHRSRHESDSDRDDKSRSRSWEDCQRSRHSTDSERDEQRQSHRRDAERRVKG